MKTLKILFALLAVSVPALCWGAPSHTHSTFRKASETIQPGQDAQSVIALLGTPAETETPDQKDVDALNATEGLVYRSPEWATVHLLVGIKDGKVTGVSMCTSVGTQAVTTECEPPEEFWEGRE